MFGAMPSRTRQIRSTTSANAGCNVGSPCPAIVIRSIVSLVRAASSSRARTADSTAFAEGHVADLRARREQVHAERPTEAPAPNGPVDDVIDQGQRHATAR